MGRRSAKIATRKGAQDDQKAKHRARIAKQVIQAAKQGGFEPETNSRLKELLHEAKQAGMPKDIVTKHLNKAKQGDQKDYTEVLHEAYGPGSTGFLVECLTDKPSRALTEVRAAVVKNGGKMAESGSVLFHFQRMAQISLPDVTSEEQVFDIATANGATDIVPRGDAEEGSRGFKVLAAVEDFGTLKSSLEHAQHHIDVENSGLVYLPHENLEVSEEDLERNAIILEKLLESDDVDKVFTNCSELQSS